MSFAMLVEAILFKCKSQATAYSSNKNASKFYNNLYYLGIFRYSELQTFSKKMQVINISL